MVTKQLVDVAKAMLDLQEYCCGFKAWDCLTCPFYEKHPEEKCKIKILHNTRPCGWQLTHKTIEKLERAAYHHQRE